MSPPLLVLDGESPSELKSVIVNSRRVRARRQTLPSETKLTVQSGFPPCCGFLLNPISWSTIGTRLGKPASKIGDDIK
jgi:hypothetical protein